MVNELDKLKTDMNVHQHRYGHLELIDMEIKGMDLASNILGFVTSYSILL